jgi:hypothetical protein
MDNQNTQPKAERADIPCDSLLAYQCTGMICAVVTASNATHWMQFAISFIFMAYSITIYLHRKNR